MSLWADVNSRRWLPPSRPSRNPPRTTTRTRTNKSAGQAESHQGRRQGRGQTSQQDKKKVTKDDDKDEDKPEPNPSLEAGKPLPKNYGDFPRELYGKPIEELDEFYFAKNVRRITTDLSWSNTLPSFVADSATVATFKRHLKTYLFARSLS